MKEFLKNITATFDTHSKGHSARKWAAFVIIVCVVAAHVKWITLGDFSQLENVLMIDYTFVASLLGMTTYEAIKNKSKAPVTTETVTTP